MYPRILAFIAIGLFCLSASAAENIPNLQTGYQDGFYLRSIDNQFGIKIGSRLNFGYGYGFVSPQTNFSSFDLYHAKLYLGGNAFGPNVQYYLQAGAARNTRSPGFAPASESRDGGFTLEDYFVRLKWQDAIVKLGQFRVPFSRQAMTYSGNFQFGDRSIPAKFFSLGRDRGVLLGSYRPTFQMSAGVFNGGGTPSTGGLMSRLYNTNGQNTSNDTLGGGEGHLYVFRMMASPFGTAGYSEGDVETSEGHRLDLGAGFVYDHDRDADLNGDGILDDNQVSSMSINAELVWKNEGRSLQGEFYYRVSDTSVGPDIHAKGFYIQPSYFLIPGQTEFAARLGWLDPSDQVDDDRILEALGALNFYFSGDHRYKVIVQYRWQGQEVAGVGRNDDHFADLLLQLTI